MLLAIVITVHLKNDFTFLQKMSYVKIVIQTICSVLCLVYDKFSYLYYAIKIYQYHFPDVST